MLIVIVATVIVVVIIEVVKCSDDVIHILTAYYQLVYYIILNIMSKSFYLHLHYSSNVALRFWIFKKTQSSGESLS